MDMFKKGCTDCLGQLDLLTIPAKGKKKWYPTMTRITVLKCWQ
jgi:hypothetical protein